MIERGWKTSIPQVLSFRDQELAASNGLSQPGRIAMRGLIDGIYLDRDPEKMSLVENWRVRRNLRKARRELAIEVTLDTGFLNAADIPASQKRQQAPLVTSNECPTLDAFKDFLLTQTPDRLQQSLLDTYITFYYYGTLGRALIEGGGIPPSQEVFDVFTAKSLSIVAQDLDTIAERPETYDEYFDFIVRLNIQPSVTNDIIRSCNRTRPSLQAESTSQQNQVTQNQNNLLDSCRYALNFLVFGKDIASANAKVDQSDKIRPTKPTKEDYLAQQLVDASRQASEHMLDPLWLLEIASEIKSLFPKYGLRNIDHAIDRLLVRQYSLPIPVSQPYSRDEERLAA